MTDATRYSKYATQVLNKYKASCRVYRILRVSNNMYCLEQIYTKQQITITHDQLIQEIRNTSNRGKLAITNPSLIVFNDKQEKKFWLGYNEQNTYHIKEDFSASTSVGSDELGGKDVICDLVNLESGHYSFHISDLVQQRLSNFRFVYITNIETLKPYIEAYLGIVDKKNAVMNIFNKLVGLFDAEYQQGKQSMKLVPSPNTVGTDITIFYAPTCKGVRIKGKHNNLQLDKEYNLTYLPTYSEIVLNKTVIKMYYDICTTFGLTAFGNVGSKQFICKAYTKNPLYMCHIRDYKRNETKLPSGSCTFVIESEVGAKWTISGALIYKLEFLARKDVLDMSFESFMQSPEYNIIAFKIKLDLQAPNNRKHSYETTLEFPYLPTEPLEKMATTLYSQLNIEQTTLKESDYIACVRVFLPLVVTSGYNLVGVNKQGNLVYRNETCQKNGLIVEAEFSEKNKAYALKQYRRLNDNVDTKTELFKFVATPQWGLQSEYANHLAPLNNVIDNFEYYMDH